MLYATILRLCDEAEMWLRLYNVPAWTKLRLEDKKHPQPRYHFGINFSALHSSYLLHYLTFMLCEKPANDKACLDESP
jgi:hypothetical protein